MLSIKCVLALYYTCVEYTAFFFGACHKSIEHFQVCYCRKFDRSILFAGAFHTNRPCRNDNISTLYFCLHSTTGSDTDKRICTTAIKLFHCNRSRWSTNTSRSYTHLYSIQCSCISYIFSVISNKNRIIKILCDLFAAFRISR